MSLPPVTPSQTTSGIAVDPKTLNRVVPESRRPDGSIRKELKIRPGFTPQEDVTRFRGKRQAQMDQNTLPKGHILGWVAPSSATKPKTSSDSGGASNKNAKKNEKRKEKRDKKMEDLIRANWEDDDAPAVKDKDGAPNWAETSNTRAKKPDAKGAEQAGGEADEGTGQDSADLDRQLRQLEIR